MEGKQKNISFCQHLFFYRIRVILNKIYETLLLYYLIIEILLIVYLISFIKGNWLIGSTSQDNRISLWRASINLHHHMVNKLQKKMHLYILC